MFATYRARYALLGQGKALELPVDEVALLSRRVETEGVSDLPLLPGMAEWMDRPSGGICWC